MITRVEGMGRIALLLAALLPGCFLAAKPAPKSAPASLQGATVFVSCSSPPTYKEPFAEREVCAALEDALHEAGLPPTSDKAKAQLALAAVVSFHGDWVQYSIGTIGSAGPGAAGKAGQLDQARFDRTACGTLATGGASARCIAGKIVEDVRESARVQAWAAEHRTAGSPGAGTATVATRPAAAGARLAVLELRNKLKGRDAEALDLGYFADLARGAALRAVPSAQVMTRENLLVLLQSQGKKLEDCEGQCDVETGRMIGADLVVSGEALRIGSAFKLDFKLHETRSGRLLAQSVASGRSADELDAETQRTVLRLFEGAGMVER
jgi:hypothetical protein